MALVNIAVELARRGRRVLAVDFDLEAPGLDTFDLPRPPGPTPGVVDLVSEYLDSGKAPLVDKFVFESSGIGSDGGGLWIMPSGAHSNRYASTFSKIDWDVLYERHDGYLLFEDLKEQWKASIAPDYVLVDSRTGHTDVGGICTRQLPDAVAILFFPNAQNLRGLTTVVRDIRSEATRRGDQEIRLHFIMSNVPDLDDEDSILQDSIAAFEENLGFTNPLIIHRYDSLSLLNQVVFTKDRPRSRLAKEYHSVTVEIMRHNPQDREGVLDYVDNVAAPRRFSRPCGLWTPRRWSEIEGHLEQIEANHSNDGEVLFRLGSLHNRLGSVTEAMDLFGRAIEAGCREPEAYLRRAEIRGRKLEDERVRSDAENVIGSPFASPPQVLRALSIIGPKNLKRVQESSALLAMPPEQRLWIARRLDTSRDEAEFVIAMLRPLLADVDQPTRIVNEARQSLVLSSIAVGRFSDAIDFIFGEDPDVSAMTIQYAFNYGMALWGETGLIECEPFARVLDCEENESNTRPNANCLQCLALAHWAVGGATEAREFAEKAVSEIRSRRGRVFSCWRYLRVSVREFEQDVEAFLRLVGGDSNVRPRFLSRGEQLLPGVLDGPQPGTHAN